MAATSTRPPHDATVLFIVYDVLLMMSGLMSTISCLLLSTPMGVDYIVIGFDMEVQPLVTHNAA